MSIYILKNSSKKFTLPLIDNEGNTYTAKPGTVKVVNSTPDLGKVDFDEVKLEGVVTSLNTNGTIIYSFQATTINGTNISGFDKVLVVDELPKEDANQVVSLYHN